ncbi:MAG: fluoride efflux transporter CrcB [Alphaproteobacteria bacterium]|nr:fluoride efflux transporter CrcB [Alphaproteobacteria bacterium]
MNEIIAVAAGGALGSVGRYLVVDQVYRWFGTSFPWGTLTVNAVGGFAIGVLAGVMAAFPALATLRLFLIAGILGGFTTFSAFSLDAIGLMARGAWGAAAAYVAGSVIASLVGTAAGLSLVRALSA